MLLASIAIITVLIFGTLAISFSLKEERGKRRLARHEEQQKILQEKILQLEEREKNKLLAMLETLTDGIFMIDTHGQLTVINNAAKTYLHLTIAHPTLTDVLAALPNTYNFGAKINTTLSQNKSLLEKDIIIGDKYFYISFTPVPDQANQTIIGVSVTLHDITATKSIAKMKEDFTNIMVHQLRNPLTSIKAGTELLATHKTLTPDEQEKVVDLISDQTSKLLDEIALILDSAKLEAGLFTIRKDPGDLRKVIEDAVAGFLPQAQQNHINLTTDIDTNLHIFSFDQRHITQVISNLISNSIKFTPGGGTIKIIAKMMPEGVTVSISDTGPGIPKEKQHLLFTKFGQIATANAYVGTGLGLYFVKGVVEAHGGKISLESEVGHGTTITFTLPIELAIRTQTSFASQQQEMRIN